MTHCPTPSTTLAGHLTFLLPHWCVQFSSNKVREMREIDNHFLSHSDCGDAEGQSRWLAVWPFRRGGGPLPSKLHQKTHYCLTQYYSGSTQYTHLMVYTTVILCYTNFFCSRDFPNALFWLLIFHELRSKFCKLRMRPEQ